MTCSSLCILGVDPGVSGAIAFYFPSAADRVAAEDVPTAGNEIDPVTLMRRLKQMGPSIAIVESVSAMPGQGAGAILHG